MRHKKTAFSKSEKRQLDYSTTKLISQSTRDKYGRAVIESSDWREFEKEVDAVIGGGSLSNFWNNVVVPALELKSVCCGAEEHGLVEGFCSKCNEATGFEQDDSNEGTEDE